MTEDEKKKEKKEKKKDKGKKGDKGKEAEEKKPEKKRRRSFTVADPEGEHEEEMQEDKPKKNLLQILASAVGGDVTAFAVPVTYNEPLSFLMRMCENLQFHDLLTKASESTDDLERHKWIGAFAVAMYAGAERTGKPFNPLLGETYNYREKGDSTQFFSEQVSHHPPIGACYCENEHFEFWQSMQVKTKFGGNHIDVTPMGNLHLRMKKTDELFSWNLLSNITHNVIVGKLWVEHVGEFIVKNHTKNWSIVFNFKKCGWFSKGLNEFSGEIKDENGKVQGTLSGKWNEAIMFDKKTEIWKNAKDDYKKKKENKYNLSSYALKLTNIDDLVEQTAPLTDSRLRPDRRALQEGDIKLAGSEKHRLEERQRAEKKKRVEAGKEWEPRYFKLQTNKVTGLEEWAYQGGFWEKQDEEEKKYLESEQK